MIVTARIVEVSWTADGFHRWPEAPEHRGYLADRHRHRFGMSVRFPVDHNERAIEFHDALDHLAGMFPAVHDFGSASCETIAEALAARALSLWALPWAEATVSEDGYVSATIRVERG